MFNQTRKMIAMLILAAFFTSSIKSPAYAQALSVEPMPQLPTLGEMVHLSPEFTPAHLQGITIHPDNALQFDFLIHKGDQDLRGDQKKEEYTKLVKYFLASLAIPDWDQWVNLSPYEKDRIIKDDFGKTEMGRDLLAEDYMLKQITSSLIYPEDGLGKKFWDRIYAQAWSQFHTTQIPVNTFNKVWIVPDSATVYESGNTAYILQSHLKVMLEEDYLSLQKHTGIASPTRGHVALTEGKSVSPSTLPAELGLNAKAPQVNPISTHELGSQLIRQIILPALEKEVNEGKNFARLRQIYSGMILAAWYKKRLKESLLGRIYADKAKLAGLVIPSSSNVIPSSSNVIPAKAGIHKANYNNDDINSMDANVIYHRYLQAFRKGVYNYIKEDFDKYTKQTIPRKYFSGGFSPNAAMLTIVKGDRLDSTSITAVNDRQSEIVNGFIDNAQVSLKEITNLISTSRVLPKFAISMIIGLALLSFSPGAFGATNHVQAAPDQKPAIVKFVHEVKHGETVLEIAENDSRFFHDNDITVENIARWNDGINPDHIHVNQKLIIEVPIREAIAKEPSFKKPLMELRVIPKGGLQVSLTESSLPVFITDAIFKNSPVSPEQILEQANQQGSTLSNIQNNPNSASLITISNTSSPQAGAGAPPPEDDKINLSAFLKPEDLSAPPSNALKTPPVLIAQGSGGVQSNGTLPSLSQNSNSKSSQASPVPISNVPASISVPVTKTPYKINLYNRVILGVIPAASYLVAAPHVGDELSFKSVLGNTRIDITGADIFHQVPQGTNGDFTSALGAYDDKDLFSGKMGQRAYFTGFGEADAWKISGAVNDEASDLGGGLVSNYYLAKGSIGFYSGYNNQSLDNNQIGLKYLGFDFERSLRKNYLLGGSVEETWDDLLKTDYLNASLARGRESLSLSLKKSTGTNPFYTGATKLSSSLVFPVGQNRTMAVNLWQEKGSDGNEAGVDISLTLKLGRRGNNDGKGPSLTIPWVASQTGLPSLDNGKEEQYDQDLAGSDNKLINQTASNLVTEIKQSNNDIQFEGAISKIVNPQSAVLDIGRISIVLSALASKSAMSYDSSEAFFEGIKEYVTNPNNKISLPLDTSNQIQENISEIDTQLGRKYGISAMFEPDSGIGNPFGKGHAITFLSSGGEVYLFSNVGTLDFQKNSLVQGMDILAASEGRLKLFDPFYNASGKFQGVVSSPEGDAILNGLLPMLVNGHGYPTAVGNVTDEQGNNFHNSTGENDRAMSPTGGIDLNVSHLNLNIKFDNKGVPLPLKFQDLVKLQNIQGFIPIIINITPVKSLLFLSKLVNCFPLEQTFAMNKVGQMITINQDICHPKGRFQVVIV